MTNEKAIPCDAAALHSVPYVRWDGADETVVPSADTTAGYGHRLQPRSTQLEENLSTAMDRRQDGIGVSRFGAVLEARPRCLERGHQHRDRVQFLQQ